MNPIDSNPTTDLSREVLLETLPELQALDGTRRLEELLDGLWQESSCRASWAPGSQEWRHGMLEKALGWLACQSLDGGNSTGGTLEGVIDRILAPVFAVPTVGCGVISAETLKELFCTAISSQLMANCQRSVGALHGSIAKIIFLAKQSTADIELAEEVLASISQRKYFAALLEAVIGTVLTWRVSAWNVDRAGEAVSRTVRDTAAVWLQESTVPSAATVPTDIYTLLVSDARAAVIFCLGSATDPDVDSLTNRALEEFLARWPNECRKPNTSATRLVRTIANRRTIDEIRSRGTVGREMLRNTSEATIAEADRKKMLETKSGDPMDDPETLELLLKVLEDCLKQARISKEERDWLDRHYLEGESWEEIAREDRISSEVVRKRMQTARGRLSECVERKTPDIPRRKLRSRFGVERD